MGFQFLFMQCISFPIMSLVLGHTRVPSHILTATYVTLQGNIYNSIELVNIRNAHVLVPDYRWPRSRQYQDHILDNIYSCTIQRQTFPILERIASGAGHVIVTRHQNRERYKRQTDRLGIDSPYKRTGNYIYHPLSEHTSTTTMTMGRIL